jgi:glycosyltransferase involved in cell wall biosynthesis
MKKIAYILDCFPVFSETFILREILELKRIGFRVLVMARTNTKESKLYGTVVHSEAEKMIKDVYYFPASGFEISRLQKARVHLYFLLVSPTRYLKTLLFSYRVDQRTFWYFKESVIHAMKLKEAGVDHIHAHYALDSCKFAMLISMLTGIPYSFTIHAHDIFLPELSDLMVEKFNNAKFVVSISEYNKNFVLDKYPAINPDKIRLIHCGVNPAMYVPHGGMNKHPTIVSVGRLEELKGFIYLIQACKILKEERGIDFICEIVGSGRQRQELEELINKSELTDQVRLLGAMVQADVSTVLNGADLFVLSCTIEKSGMRDGIPVALMEAMAMEIPAVSTNVSGVPELVKSGAGLLVEPKEVDQLALAIEKILLLDEQERKEMGKMGRALVENEFNLEKEVRKLADLFNG